MSTKPPTMSTRLFSILTQVTRKANRTATKTTTAKIAPPVTPASSSLAQSDITKAIDLLTNNNKLYNTHTHITGHERDRFIDQFTEVLNSNIPKHDELNSVKNHFEQSLKGLSSLIDGVTTNDVNSMDYVTLKQRVARVKDENDLLNIFDCLIHGEKLNLANLRLILMNKNCFNLRHILKKFEFMDPEGKEFDDLKILVVIKSVVLGDKKLALEVYSQSIHKWVKSYEKDHFKGSIVLNKSFFQVIYKIDRDLKLLQRLTYDNKSLVLLCEALPRQINYYISEIQSNCNGMIKLSRNQQHFITLMMIISKNATNQQSLIKKVIKSSVCNKIHLEQSENDSDLTLLQYRFHNELISIVDEMKEMEEEFKNDTEFKELVRELKDDDEVVGSEMLKFV